MLVPNRRDLINRLLGTDGFKEREPQQFGMVCFTELLHKEAAHHRESFGDYGIAVSWEWALGNGAQRVLYVEDGSVMNALSWLFKFARQELERDCPEDVGEFLLANKHAAAVYGQMYYWLLTLYEYMEPGRNSSQVEWRIVNKTPYYHRSTDCEEVISELLDLANKGFGTLRVLPNDVEALVSPAEEIGALRKAIPSEFGSVPILSCTRPRTIQSRVRAIIEGFRLIARRRTRIVYRDPEVGYGRRLRRSERFAEMFELPAVENIGGIAVFPGKVLERAHCDLQFRSGGQEYELQMTFTGAVELAVYLREMMKDPKLRDLVQLAARQIDSKHVPPKQR